MNHDPSQPYELDYNTLGKEFDAWMKHQGLKDKEVGARVKIHPQTVSKLRKGMRVHPGNVYALFHAVGLQDRLPLHRRTNDGGTPQPRPLDLEHEYGTLMLKRGASPVYDADDQITRHEGLVVRGACLNCQVFEIHGITRGRKHPGHELIYVIEGRIIIRTTRTEAAVSTKDEFMLSTGDLLSFSGKNPHQYENACNKPSKFLSVWTAQDYVETRDLTFLESADFGS